MMLTNNNFLKLRLVLFILKGNCLAFAAGKITLGRFFFALRKQIIIASNFSGAKYTKIREKIFIDPFAPYFPSRSFLKVLENNSHDRLPLKPNYAQISITNRCPCRCFHCHVKNTQDKNDLNRERIVQAVEDIAKQDFPLIFFVGGEPMERFSDLLDFIKTAAQQDLDTRIFTSGVGVTPERLTQLKSAGLHGICISIDHHVEAEHNRLRRHPQAFASACKAVQEARAQDFYVSIVCCVRSPYVASGEFEKMVLLAEELGAHSIQLNEIRPVGRARDSQDESFSLCREDKETLIRYYHRENSSARKIAIVMPWYNEEPDKFGCTATSGQTAYIDSYGNVQPCQLVKVRLGNINQKRFAEIWQGFLPNFSHPVRDCLVYPVNEILTAKQQEFIAEDAVMQHWPDLCQQETTDMFKRFKVKPTVPQTEQEPTAEDLAEKYNLTLQEGHDFHLLAGHWLPMKLNVPYIALGNKLYCQSEGSEIPRHEFLHIAQFDKYGFSGVISHYLRHMLVNYIHCRNAGEAFRNIPFEQEARLFEQQGKGRTFL
ncbi:MAG: radical SAM protein [Candidatus Electrothrix sp. AR4]|nr:radical SAM protein [Candidatus Electrothrix sp. AR4]